MDKAIFEHLGFKAEFEADLVGGYTFPVGWVHEDDENFFVFNPNGYISAAIDGKVTFKLYWIEWSIAVSFVLERFSPLSYSGLWSLDHKD